MAAMKTIESSTNESLAIEVTTSSDPTGTPPEFSIVIGTNPIVYVPGTWLTTWDATTGAVKALSPRIGTGQPLPIEQGNDYNLYARWDAPATSETPVRLVERIRAT